MPKTIGKTTSKTIQANSENVKRYETRKTQVVGQILNRSPTSCDPDGLPIYDSPFNLSRFLLFEGGLAEGVFRRNKQAVIGLKSWTKMKNR